MKAEKLIKLAYFNIGKTATYQDLKPFEGQVAVDKLNDLMLENADLNLGYTFLENTGQDITTPNWSWRWMQYALSLELAPFFPTSDVDLAQIRELKNDAFSSVLTRTIDPYWVDDNAAVVTENSSVIVTEDS